MNIEIRAYSNVDQAVIVWKPDQFIKDARGFVLYRYRKNPKSDLGQKSEETVEKPK